MIEWYNKRAWNESITQGQIILECPVQISEKENGEIVSSTYLVDIIVVSQSCDLENRKIDNIVVAELIDLPMGNSKKDTLKKLEAINSNTMPRYHLIKRYSEDGFELEPKLVDFGNIHTVPLEYLESIISDREGYTIALNSPYREFVSQRFGMFFARIGLPLGITKGELESYRDMIHEKSEIDVSSV